MSRNINFINKITEDIMRKAVLKNYKYTTIDMLFLYVIKDKTIYELLQDMNIKVDIFIKAVEKYIARNVEQVSTIKDINIISIDLAKFLNHLKLEYGDDSKRLTIAQVLMELLDYKCYGVDLLIQNGFDKEIFEKSIKKLHDFFDKDDKYIVNINKMVSSGKYDPVIGREKEIERMINILSRKTKNNPLIVGEPGVGKTAIVIGLVERIISGNVPDGFKNKVVKQLNLNSLIAGTKFRGDFEERVEHIIDEVLQEKNIILFIDEFHNVVGAGSSTHNQGDLSEIIKPILVDKDFALIGATTFEDLKKIEKDSAMMRRFQQLPIEEPTLKETIDIIKGIKKYYEDFHNVKYSDNIIAHTVEYAKTYIKNRKLPDSAIDIIDEVGAYYKNLKHIVGYEITQDDIENIIAKYTKMPKESINKEPSKIIEKLEKNMVENLYNQDEAIEHIVDAIIINKSGMSDPDKPIASFLFTGPTGVGKTEAARILAESLGYELVRFDMGEFNESHSVSKFIGSPAGYVGFDEGGLLVNKVKNNPHCVLLFDEIEKAHPQIFNTLLSVLEEGELTDGRGITAYFNNTIIIMTSNSGAVIEEKGMGFISNKNEFEKEKRNEIIKQQFPPEFRNRLSAIIQFNSLNKDVMYKVLDKFIKNLNIRINSNNKNNIVIKLDKKAKNYFIEKGFDITMGARPLKRIISNEIEKKVGREIIFGKLKNGGIVNISVKNNSLVFKYSNSKTIKKDISDYSEKLSIIGK